MAQLLYAHVFSNGHPSTVQISPQSNYNFYVDMEGGQDIQFNYGSVSIPIESIAYYKQYEKLPSIRLQRYFKALLRAVYAHQYIGCDICALHQEILTKYWNYWLEQGYVTKADPLPFPLAVMGMAPETQKKKRWF